MPRPRMDEGNRPFRAATRLPVDELHAVGSHPLKSGTDVGDLVTHVVHALATGGKEPRHTGRVVRRLHELDLGLAHAEERDAHAVGRDVEHGLERQPEDVAVERQRLLDRADDDRDVMDASGRVDGRASSRP